MPDAVVCCADDYFMKDGVYNWYPEGLGKAHAHSWNQFKDALDNTDKNIIVANVNAKPSDWNKYVVAAKDAGFLVTFVVLENRHNGKDTHNVPEVTLERQEKTIRENLKLR